MAFTPSRSGPSGPPFQKRGFRNRFEAPQDEHRINERIRVPQVRLIDEKGTQVGVVDTRKALQMAKDRGLDLMEVSPNSKPPVCKILDYGKFKYEKKKKEQIAKKKQVVVKVKEVQLRPNTEAHDLDTKLRKARGFLEDGDKVKFTLMFRGRQMAHQGAGRQLMKDLQKRLEDLATVEFHPKMEGRRMIMIVAPLTGAAKKAAAKAKEAKEKDGKAEAKDAKSSKKADK